MCEPFNCGANPNQSKTIRPGTLVCIHSFPKGTWALPYLVLYQLNDANVYKGLSKRDSTLSLLPTVAGVGGTFTLKIIKS